MKIIPLLLFPLLLFIGCSVSEQPRQVAQNYTTALLEKDWEEACRWIEEESRQRGETISGQSCEDDLRQATRDWTSETRSGVSLYKLYVREDRAAFQTDVYNRTLFLRKGDDGWRITFFEE